MSITNVAALFGVLFADDQEAAFSCYRTFQTLGLVAAFVSSTGGGGADSRRTDQDDDDDDAGGLRWPPCISTKLYVMSVLLAISLVLYAAAEYTLPRRAQLISGGTGGWSSGARSFRSSSSTSTTLRDHAQRRRAATADFRLVEL